MTSEITLTVRTATVNDLVLGDDSNNSVLALTAKTQAGFDAVEATLKG